jgi:hypothetical protein
MSLKKYDSTAERQRAYRQRLKLKLAGLLPAPLPQPTAPRKRSRPKRLATALAELQALSGEYQAWLDKLPDNLGDSEIAGQLQEAIDELDAAADVLEALDLPRGFGR